MSAIHLNDVRKSYGANEVIRGVTWRIEPTDRVGLVGRNGCGKTTLFHLVTERALPDDGAVHRRTGLRIGFLPQDPEFQGESTVLRTALRAFQHLLDLGRDMAELEARMSEGDASGSLLSRYGQMRDRYEMDGGYAVEAKAKAILFGLGFQQSELEQQVVTLSGGQKNRLMLAQLLAIEPELLLLDEPTNHLDLQAVEWLEGFLAAYSGAFVIISHDRYFLDRTAGTIAELENGKLSCYAGNYSFYAAEKARRFEQRRKAFVEQRALIEKTEDYIRRNMAGQKTKQAQSRQKMLDRLERIDRPAGQRNVSLRFKSSARGGDMVLEAEDLSARFGDRVLYSGLDLVLRREDRIGIVGPNGSGKTTLLRVLTGERRPDEGRVRLGRNIRIGYYDQARQDLDVGSTVIEEVWQVTPDATMAEMRSFLGLFLFSGDEVDRAIGSLSGGERSRVALAKLMRTPLNLLVLDEPTNHLDIPARTVLEDALDRFDGTLVSVSHDRYFLNRLANRLLVLEEGRHRMIEGNYDALLRRRQTEAVQEVSTPASAEKASRKEAYRRARRETRDIQKRERMAGRLQDGIAELEREAQRLDDELVREDLATDWEQLEEINRQRDGVQKRMDACFAEWEAIEQELDRMRANAEDTGRR